MGKRKQISTSHSEIFDFWKDKYINRNGEIVSNYEKDELLVIRDWGEPECWCCGKFCKGIYKHIKYEDDLKDNIHKIWNYGEVKSMLNRCHIIPYSLGGSSEPENLFLLCESCHIQSPDCIESKLFFKWIYYKRKQKKCIYNGFDIDNMLLEMKYNIDFFNVKIEELSYEHINELYNQKISSHGGKISESTIIMNLIDIIKKE